MREGESVSEAVTSRTAATNESHAQHTPGPLEHDADGEDETPGGCRITISKDGAPIAEVLNSDDFPCLTDEGAIVIADECARADARLFAAAPDLLSACKLALNAFERRDAIDWNELATTIAKAEGREHEPRTASAEVVSQSPQAQSCLLCGSVDMTESAALSLRSGEFICRRCGQIARAERRLSAEYPMSMLRWDGDNPCVVMTRDEFVRLDQKQAHSIVSQPPQEEAGSVIQPWAMQLPIRMQSTMLLAMRGPDGCSKHNSAKILLRQLRSAVLVPAFPGQTDSFMGDQRGYADWSDADSFLDDHDEYPHHWLMHFIHAVEIVGQFHPNDVGRAFWWRLYLALCAAFHMRNENIDELTERLAASAEGSIPSPTDREK